MSPVDTLSNPFPKGISSPAGSSQGLGTNLGQAISFFNTSRRQLWTQQYQFGIQRQLPGQILAEAAYAGTRTNDFPVTVALNATPRDWQAQAREAFINTKRNMLSDTVSNPFFGLIPAGPLSLANTTRGQLLVKYPHFTGVGEMSLNDGSTRYDSLQVKVNKRLSRGLSFLAAYTLSKLIEETSYLNANDAQLTRRLSAYDAPQRLVLSGSWQLPMGKDRKLFAGARGVAGKLVEGWQANFVYTAQSGVPITIAGGESTGRSGYLPNGERTLQRWFDPSAFRLRETLEFASTATLPDVRTPGTNNFDLSLYKNTQIAEAVKLQFRAESYNLFNRVAFGSPGATVGSASFGVISSQINFSRQLQFGLKLLW